MLYLKELKQKVKLPRPEMALNAPCGLKNSNIFWGRPPDAPRGREHPPPPHLALCAKMAAEIFTPCY